MRFEADVLNEIDPLLLNTGDSYHFGIFVGTGLKRFLNVADKMQRMPHHCWGFDTFTGFPDDMRGRERYTVSFDARSELNLDNAWEVRNAVMARLAYHPAVTLLPGRFSESLQSELIQQYSMQPACLVDIDCDLYESTVDALKWLIDCELLVSGTLVYYDDWSAFKIHEDGESLAHDELLADMSTLVWAKHWGPHRKVLFRIR